MADPSEPTKIIPQPATPSVPDAAPARADAFFPLGEAHPAHTARFAIEKPGDFIGRYRLIEKLGEGGFGIVWRAEQLKPIHREVALKVIKAGMDSAEIIARFEAERQALALMDHPNIAAVLDAGATESGRPFFAMELVKGCAITEYCDANQLTIRQRLELFIPVCLAVQHAHQKAILHRDLKPSNILIAEVDGKPVPKVIDFGIAKALGASPETALASTLARTQDGLIVGTPQYMSPEQAGSVPDVDTRSDVYALGIILYELLTGQTPLAAQELRKAAFDQMLRLVREGEAKRPSSRFIPVNEMVKQAAARRQTEPQRLSHALRGDLDWIVLMVLEKDRDRRYQTANALALDIRRHLQNEPVSASPPSAAYRFGKMVRRHKGAVVATAAVLVCLLAGITGTGIALLREKKALSREAAQRQRAENERKTAARERDRAEDALASLKKTAPTFAAQARALVEQGNLEDALEKIGYAVSLDKGNADYLLQQANFLQAAQKLAKAAEGYRGVLALRADAAAKMNLELCEKLLRDNEGSDDIKRESQELLVNSMIKQGRAVEAASLSNSLGGDSKAALAAIDARLKPLRAVPGSTAGVTRLPNGTFSVRFSSTVAELPSLSGLPITEVILKECNVSDLTPLKGLRLQSLDIGGTPVSDLTPIEGMPIETLNASSTNVTDLTPLKRMPLTTLILHAKSPATPSRISDLSPLRGMPLKNLDLHNCSVADLRPLAGMPIEVLDIRFTAVSDLSPLTGMPLTSLKATRTKITDVSPLRGIPLRFLSLVETAVSDLNPLAGMPIEELDIASTKVTDIGVLRTLPLKRLKVQCPVKDLRPLADCKELQTLQISKVTADISFLRALPNLQRLSDDSNSFATMDSTPAAEEFWKKYDAQKAAK